METQTKWTTVSHERLEYYEIDLESLLYSLGSLRNLEGVYYLTSDEVEKVRERFRKDGLDVVRVFPHPNGGEPIVRKVMKVTKTL